MISRLLPVLVSVFCIFLNQHAHANGGDKVGGGGAQLESAFRLRGFDLINQVAASPEAQALCAATTMQEALEGARIRLVDTLMDPATGRPISGQQLDAWTIPGDIQLLKSSWAVFLINDFKQESGRSIDVLILHEIYRAIAGTVCSDEGFKLSTRVPTMLKQPQVHSRLFKLTQKVALRVRGYEVYGMCDALLQKVNDTATCLTLLPTYTNAATAMLSHVTSTKWDPGSKLWIVTANAITVSEPYTKDAFKIQNMMGLAWAEQPFFVVVDMQTGNVGYGLDLNHLIWP